MAVMVLNVAHTALILGLGVRLLQNSCFKFALLTVSRPLKKDPPPTPRFFPIYRAFHNVLRDYKHL